MPRELSKRRGNVEVVGNIAEMGAVGLQRFFSKAAGGGVSQKDVKGFFKGDFLCFGTSCGHLNSCHGSDLLSHPNSDEKTGGHSFFRKKEKPLKLLEFQGFFLFLCTKSDRILFHSFL